MTKRELPHNVEAEQSVLGGIMLDSMTMNDVSLILRAEDFYKSTHQIIYSAMMDLNEKNIKPDTLTLNEELKKKGKLKDAGDTSYIAFLSSSVPTAANIEFYAKIVKEKAQRRKMISLGITLSEEAYDETNELEQYINKAEQTVYDISNDKSRIPYHRLGSLIKSSFDYMKKIYKSGKKVPGIPSGFADLDDLTDGFQLSDLIIIAARPSMGKTALALNIAMNTALAGSNVIIFSLEMSRDQLANRMISMQSNINLKKIRNPNRLFESDWGKLTPAAVELNDLPIYIDDTPDITPIQLKAKCRRRKAEGSLDLVIVDYLQLMIGRRNKSNNREQEIADISRSLKILAKELGVPVIALSQLNRACELRDNKRPRLSDLRESGAIEQDADVIGFIYRDEVYNRKSEDKGMAELLIRKQRNGPIGTVRLTFKKEYARFYDCEDEYKMYEEMGEEE